MWELSQFSQWGLFYCRTLYVSQSAQVWIRQFYLQIHHAYLSFISVHQLRRQKCFIISVLFQRPHMWNKLFYLLYSMRHNVTWLNSRWWLAACDWLTSRVMKYDTIAMELRTSRKQIGGVGCLYGTYNPGERLWINSHGKMETEHPVENQFGCEFLAICNHCGIMTAWSRKNWKFCEQFLRFVYENHPLW